MDEFKERFVHSWRMGKHGGWPGPNVNQGDLIPESDPTDNTPTAGLLSNQVVPVHLTENDFQLN